MEVHVSVAPETLWSLHAGPLTLNITNSFLMMLIVMSLLCIVGAIIARRATLVPGAAQSIFEMVAEFILGLVEGSAGTRLGRTVYPLVAGLFIFIIVGNYAGLIPGVGTIGVERNGEFAPLLRSSSADLNMTLAMAILTFVIVQIVGIKAHGFGGRIKHMANPPFLFPIELVSELSRIISLSFRLFGNIFAGEALLIVMDAIGRVTLIGVVVPVVFLYLEVLFGFIQALVFALLTLVYIVLAASGEHEEHGHESGHLEEPAELEAQLPHGAAAHGD